MLLCIYIYIYVRGYTYIFNTYAGTYYISYCWHILNILYSISLSLSLYIYIYVIYSIYTYICAMLYILTGASRLVSSGGAQGPGGVLDRGLLVLLYLSLFMFLLNYWFIYLMINHWIEAYLSLSLCIYIYISCVL